MSVVDITSGHPAFTVSELKWHRRFLHLARHISSWSKDPSTQTGCVVTDGMRHVLSLGYNGFPRGVADDPERYADRELKYKMVAHCDLNAIFSAAKLGICLEGGYMYLTGPPCNECAKGIIQAGISVVLWPADNAFERDRATQERWAESFRIMQMMMAEANVALWRVHE